MVSVTKYATVVSDPTNTWTNKNNALGAPDTVCAESSTSCATNRFLKFTDFGFNIPLDATLTSVKAGAKWIGWNAYGAGYYILCNLYTYRTGRTFGDDKLYANTPKVCSNVEVFAGLEQVPVMLWTPALLNDASEWWMHVWPGQYVLSIGCVMLLDSVWLTVVYTEAAVAVPYGDGLTWIVALFKRKGVILRNLIQTRQRLKLL